MSKTLPSPTASGPGSTNARARPAPACAARRARRALSPANAGLTQAGVCPDSARIQACSRLGRQSAPNRGRRFKKLSNLRLSPWSRLLDQETRRREVND
jgi:hypothetical protein